ncbi:UDP-N-acetylmuramate dehydrogenase [Aquimarina sp. TRL1]|uniref:UDP-N-acetylmuramate dehydrogenase n=1 Tax=Aquimarina sp. (strain TRL1) TaxID=2736252 RepID=UPI00158A0A83|nr:UDP-N-acetylmuramate dehydrogenase [Aquimarina sp. TRL1]QKX07503.1 UDP-N-acetylmuramate dehydrogenase [Aquimarina sp. TRL1]
MNIEYKKSLKKYNTFGIDVTASEFISIQSEGELIEVLKLQKPFFVLSGGSNMLLTKNIEALVIHMNNKGISVENTSDTSVQIKAMAGENWHDFVQYCVTNDYGGLENLSLIPGCVGSAPIQNIGAYGVELKDSFIRCSAIHIKTREKRIFTKEECMFGYRNSIFKNDIKGQYIITSVTFELTHKTHTINTSYGAIEKELSKNEIEQPTIRDIANAVIAIRKSKLPDPKEIGNSGSFFKNPVIPTKLFTEIKAQYPEIPSYPVDDQTTKVPAGWLIEQCGFKGKRWGDAGIHKNQALVLVNYGNATGKEIVEISRSIQKEVADKFNIVLETEVNII